MELICQLSSLSLEKVDKTNEMLLVQNKEKKLETNLKGFHWWKNVYKKVPNQDKKCMSLIKRVIKGKSVDNEKLVKARCCARGSMRNKISEKAD